MMCGFDPLPQFGSPSSLMLVTSFIAVLGGELQHWTKDLLLGLTKFMGFLCVTDQVFSFRI